MPFNGAGVYTLPAGNPVVTNTTISSTVHNNTNSDIATALTNTITKDGQSTPTANLPMGGYVLTGLGAGAGNGQSVRYDEFNGHLVDTVAAHSASAISNTPAGGIAATDVQSALSELDARVGRGAGDVPSNTAIGANALSSNTSGANTTAVGVAAGYSNTTGSYNSFVGTNAGYSNTTGYNNSFIGTNAGYSNTTGNYNSFVGTSAGRNNTTGYSNSFDGMNAGYSNTTGYQNSFVGTNAGYSNTTGYNNSFVGSYAGYNNTTGYSNSFDGMNAGRSNTTGYNNSFVGSYAGYNNTTGNGNIGIGGLNSAGVYAPAYNITTQNNFISMGSASVTNAYIQVPWTVTSDRRDKRDFSLVPHGLEFVNQLNPIKYRFKLSREDDTPNGNYRYGFGAQDILALEGDNPVIIDAADTNKLRYNGESLVPVLVNAIKELSAKVDALQLEINNLKGY